MRKLGNGRAPRRRQRRPSNVKVLAEAHFSLFRDCCRAVQGAIKGGPPDTNVIQRVLAPRGYLPASYQTCIILLGVLGHGLRFGAAPFPLRLYHHVPLHLCPAQYGPGAPGLRPQEHRSENRQRPLQPRRALLDPVLRDQLRGRRGHRRPHGVSVRHQLVAVRQSGRRRDRPDAGDGGRVRVLPGIQFPRLTPVWGKETRPEGSLADLLAPVRRHMAFGVLHHRDRRVDAAPGRLLAGAERQCPAPKLLGPAPQSMGRVDVPAQHDRHGRDRRLRHGFRRRVLFADAAF